MRRYAWGVPFTVFALVACSQKPTAFSTPESYRVSINISGSGVERLKRMKDQVEREGLESVKIDSGMNEQEKLDADAMFKRSVMESLLNEGIDPALLESLNSGSTDSANAENAMPPPGGENDEAVRKSGGDSEGSMNKVSGGVGSTGEGEHSGGLDVNPPPLPPPMTSQPTPTPAPTHLPGSVAPPVPPAVPPAVATASPTPLPITAPTPLATMAPTPLPFTTPTPLPTWTPTVPLKAPNLIEIVKMKIQLAVSLAFGLKNLGEFKSACAIATQTPENKIVGPFVSGSVAPDEVLLVIAESSDLKIPLQGSQIRGICAWASKGARLQIEGNNTKVGTFFSYQSGSGNKTDLEFSSVGKLNLAFIAFRGNLGATNVVELEGTKMSSCSLPNVNLLGQGTVSCKD